MKNILLFIFLVSIANITHADTLKNKHQAKKLVESVMQHIGKGNVEKGLNLTKPYLIIPLHEFDGVLNSLRMQAPMMNQRFGKTIGVELLKTEEVGKSLMLIMYIQKFEKHLMRWRFYFYKGQKGWVLNTFKTDDRIKEMFSY